MWKFFLFFSFKKAAKQKSSELKQLPEVCAWTDADTCGRPTGRVQHHPRCLAQNPLLSAAFGDAAHKGSWRFSSCLAISLITSIPSAIRETLVPRDEDGDCVEMRSKLTSGLGRRTARSTQTPSRTKAHTASCLAALVPREKGVKKGKQEI